MATLTSDNLDVNTSIIEAADGSMPGSLIATAYFEDYLFKLLTDLIAINDEISAGSVTDGDNVGTGVQVFAQKNGTILEFRTLVSADASVTITQGANEIDLAAASLSGTTANAILTFNIGTSEYTELPEFTVSWSAGVATISVEDDAGVLQTIILADADAGLELFYDGTSVAETATAATGGFFANNTLTGAGLERVLTVSDIPGGAVLPVSTISGSHLVGDGAAGWNELPEVTLAWIAGVATWSVEDDAAALQTVITADADAGLAGYFDGIIAFDTHADGISVYDTGGDDPFIVFYDDAVAQVGFIEYNANGTRFISDRNVNVDIRSDDSSAVQHNLFVGDPDGSAELGYDGSPTLRTEIFGASFADSTVGEDPAIAAFSDTTYTTRFGFIQFSAAAGGMVMRSEIDGQSWTIDATDAGSAVVNLLVADPDGSVDLYYDGSTRFITTIDGAEVEVSAVSDTIFDVIGSGLNIDGKIGIRGDSGGIRFVWDESVPRAFIYQTNAAGTQQDIFASFTTNAAVSLYYNGTARLFTEANGIRVTGPVMSVDNTSAATATSMKARNSEGGIAIESDGDDGTIYQTAPNGALEDVWIMFINDGQVELYFNDILEASTKSGGFVIDDELEIDGDLNHDGSNIGFYGTAPAAQSAAYTRNAAIVEDRTLLASASATIVNNNNVLAALIADLQSIGILA